MLFLLFSPTFCHAQASFVNCDWLSDPQFYFTGFSYTGTQAVSNTLVPGQTYKVTAGGWGVSPAGCLYEVIRVYNSAGQIDPYVTTSPVFGSPDQPFPYGNYVDATHTAFTITVASGTPDEVDIIQLLCEVCNSSASYYDAQISIQTPLPPSPPPPPPCGTITINPLTPSTWTMGKTYHVTITGTDFVAPSTSENPTYCQENATRLWVQQGGDSGVDYGGIEYFPDFKVVSPTQITATIKMDASTSLTAGPAILWVGNCDDGCVTETTVPVQIVECDVPNITEIKPNTWFAGKTYGNVVIKGSGFTTSDKAIAACPVTAINITAADNSVVPVSTVNVDSKTKITLTGVAPPASDPTEAASVTAGTAPNTATATAQIEALSATVTDTGKIQDGTVKVKLVAPGGTAGDLTLNLYGENDTYTQDFTSLSPGSQKLDFDLTSVPPDTYSTADGTWNANLSDGSGAQSVNVPSVTLAKEWIYLGLTRFSQYNAPYESQCSGGSQPMYVFDRSSCTYASGQLNAKFISKTQLNGTGMSINYGLLKPIRITNAGKLCKGKLPPGASSLNTFVQVSTVTGSCNTAIAANHSVATFPNPNGKEETPLLLCKDSLNLDQADNTTAYTRVVADKCPACIDGNHIDSFTDNQACDAHGAIGDLGNFYTSTTR